MHQIFLHYLKYRMVIISLHFPSKTQFLLKGCVFTPLSPTQEQIRVRTRVRLIARAEGRISHIAE